MNDIVAVIHNVRSAHNVGSILRTADGLGISKVYLTGYTPYPASSIGDERLPHVARKTNARIAKTALGAENSRIWQHKADIAETIAFLKSQGYKICAIEQDNNSTAITDFRSSGKTALIFGNEVDGLEQDVLKLCDIILEIPMSGMKESLNVAQAAAIAFYHFRYSHLHK